MLLESIAVLQRNLLKLTAIAMLLFVSGCATIFMDQAGTGEPGNYLVVGHDGGPNRQVWVIEGNEQYSVSVKEQ